TQIAAAKESMAKLLAAWSKEHFIIVKSDYRPHQFGEGLFLCIPGTFGHHLDKDLNLDEEMTFFVKAEHSAFSSAPFLEYLEKTGIDTLVLCGFLAEYCVQQTAMDAIASGYTVFLLDDCIGTGDDVQHRKQQMMENLKQKGAQVTNSAIYKPR
ncbi:MAG: cysteine hydrolase, partial [Bacteroidota bacterium]|nr:cysteine hydrolase [Bacteroidota bacterium]